MVHYKIAMYILELKLYKNKKLKGEKCVFVLAWCLTYVDICISYIFFTQIYLTVIVSKTYSFPQKANKINDYESLWDVLIPTHTFVGS